MRSVITPPRGIISVPSIPPAPYMPIFVEDGRMVRSGREHIESQLTVRPPKK